MRTRTNKHAAVARLAVCEAAFGLSVATFLPSAQRMYRLDYPKSGSVTANIANRAMPFSHDCSRPIISVVVIVLLCPPRNLM
jgi:hypothetical protein